MKKPRYNKRIYTEEQKQEIQIAYNKSHNIKERARLLCIKLRVVKGMSTKQISEITEMSESYINEITHKYIKKGIESLRAKEQTSHNRNMTFEEESKFLEQFKTKAIAGEVLEVSEIIKAYSEALNNKKVSKSTVYDMLHRHKWRKVMPRSEHPKKANEEKIVEYKKKFQTKWEIY